MIFGVVKGRRDDEYAYWFCLGRHTYKNGCDLPYMAAEKIEAAVVRQWRTEHMDEQTITGLEANLLAGLRDYTRITEDEATRLDQRIHAIKRERYKWADKAMDGSVPGEIAREKQQQLGTQLAQAKEQRARLHNVRHGHKRNIRTALRLLKDCGLAYEQGTDSTRRAYNQAWFDKLPLPTRRRWPSSQTRALPTSQLAAPTTRTWNSGVHAFGLDAAELAENVADLLRGWHGDRHDGPGPQFRVYPSGTPEDQLPEGCVIDKMHSRVTISWAQAMIIPSRSQRPVGTTPTTSHRLENQS